MQLKDRLHWILFCILGALTGMVFAFCEPARGQEPIIATRIQARTFLPAVCNDVAGDVAIVTAPNPRPGLYRCTSTNQWTREESMSGVVNMASLGALPNGADITTTFNTAIASLPLTGGTLYFPPSGVTAGTDTYDIDGAVVINRPYTAIVMDNAVFNLGATGTISVSVATHGVRFVGMSSYGSSLDGGIHGACIFSTSATDALTVGDATNRTVTFTMQDVGMVIQGNNARALVLNQTSFASLTRVRISGLVGALNQTLITLDATGGFSQGNSLTDIYLSQGLYGVVTVGNVSETTINGGIISGAGPALVGSIGVDIADTGTAPTGTTALGLTVTGYETGLRIGSPDNFMPFVLVSNCTTWVNFLATANRNFIGIPSMWAPAVTDGGANNSVYIPSTLQINPTGSLLPGPLTFATLGAPTNGTVVYCSDCTFANPCAAAGTGAIAKRLNGAWRCD